MKTNLGLFDKAIRIAASILVMVLLMTTIIPMPGAIFGWIVVAVLIITSVTGRCPIYGMFGINTKKNLNDKAHSYYRNQMKSNILYLCSLSLVLTFYSCKKEAGEGGTSSIRGKVYSKYYNKNFSVLADSGYAPDTDVYIIYGDDFSFGDRQKTSYDGSYEFKYLQKGNYKVYAYAEDSTGAYSNHVNQYAPDIAIIKDVSITKNRQKVEVEDIHIVQ